jgi:hypothetical protein
MRKLLTAVLGFLFATAGSLVVLASPAAAETVTIQFAYTGAVQQWVVPPEITLVAVELFGGQGGTGSHPDGPDFIGGTGGRTVSFVAVTPGETLRILVGGQGKSGAEGGAGGFNGGGNGVLNEGAASGGGGGASDIRQGGIQLVHRVAVAGGGGGGLASNAVEVTQFQGRGGGAAGERGEESTTGDPFESLGGGSGTPSSGGAAGSSSDVPAAPGATPGGSGIGGNGGVGVQGASGGGGGGGYFGGGGGGAIYFVGAAKYAGGGGGGSGYEPTGFGSSSFSDHIGHGEVTISYEPPPVAVDDHYTTPAGQELTVEDSGLVANDENVNGLTQHIQDDPSHGVLEQFNVGRAFRYTPNPGFVGTDSFHYCLGRFLQAGCVSNIATVTIEVVGTLPGAPTGVSAARGNAQASVSFTPPASDGGSPILDYTATCGSRSKTGPASPLVVTGLTNGITVSCTVTARNAQGSGPASSPPVAVKPATVPGAPQNVSATPGNAQATVRFAKPLTNGGSAITSYTATCGSKSKTGTGSPLVVTSLANGVTVNCTVKATNVIGAGPASSPPVPVRPRP